MQDIVIRAEIAAPPAAVFEVLADYRGMERWAGVREVVIAQEGDPPPGGFGAVRVIRAHGLAIEEEITSFDPPRRLAYRLSAGLPVRDYLGEVRLAPSGAGTELAWAVRFRALVPGTGLLLRALIARSVATMVRGLAAEFCQR